VLGAFETCKQQMWPSKSGQNGRPAEEKKAEKKTLELKKWGRASLSARAN
jgi:hypothetical protein